jgi:hypothetical protein
MARRARRIAAADDISAGDATPPAPEPAPAPAAAPAVPALGPSTRRRFSTPWLGVAALLVIGWLYAWNTRTEDTRRAEAIAQRLDAIDAALLQPAAPLPQGAPASPPTIIVRNIVPSPRAAAKQAETCADCPVVRRVVRMRNGRARLE